MTAQDTDRRPDRSWPIYAVFLLSAISFLVHSVQQLEAQRSLSASIARLEAGDLIAFRTVRLCLDEGDDAAALAVARRMSGLVALRLESRVALADSAERSVIDAVSSIVLEESRAAAAAPHSALDAPCHRAWSEGLAQLRTTRSDQ